MTFGLVPASTLRDDHYVLSNDGTSMIGRKSKRRFSLNDRIDVVVAKVDRFKRLIDFSLASESTDASPAPSIKPKRKSKPASAKKSARKSGKQKSAGKNKPSPKRSKTNPKKTKVRKVAERPSFVPKRLRK